MGESTKSILKIHAAKSEGNVEETMKDFFTPHINCLSLNHGKNQ